MNLEHVIARRFDDVEQQYDARDSALYALALGYGSDPLDAVQRRYAVEHAAQLVAPSQAVMLGWPPFWQAEPEAGIDWKRLLHGEQRVTFFAPLPTAARLRATHRVVAVEDKGRERGAILHFEIVLHDAVNGERLALLEQAHFYRGDGGCGQFGTPPEALPPIAADRPADASIDLPTLPQTALLYRAVSGDLNPLHVEPQLAREAGFAQPITHGLHSFGLACRALLQTHAPLAPGRLCSMSARFAAVAYPGDTIRIEMVDDGPLRVRFRARALERQVLVLDRGSATFADTPIT